MSRSVDDIRRGYSYDASCQRTVPEAITAFLESDNFEDAIRKAISLGGDADTLACIAGGIAQAFYKEIPETISLNVKQRLTPELLSVLEEFQEEYRL